MYMLVCIIILSLKKESLELDFKILGVNNHVIVWAVIPHSLVYPIYVYLKSYDK